jgi:predicted RNase H-like HicB family nuclease
MKINIVYKEEKGLFVGHIQEYPDYESQGETLDELRNNLIEIYNDIRKGLVPDAEPFHVLEVAI